jgi:hypothetical protein
LQFRESSGVSGLSLDEIVQRFSATEKPVNQKASSEVKVRYCITGNCFVLEKTMYSTVFPLWGLFF